MKFNLGPQDHRLIDAAIGLGDWLLQRGELDTAQRRSVQALQRALRALPEPTDGVHAGYGFDVTDEAVKRAMDSDGGPEPTGLSRCWEVCYSARHGRHTLEIFNIVTTFPRVEMPCWSDMQQELMLRREASSAPVPGDGGDHDPPGLAETWVAAVSNPTQFIGPGVAFEVEAWSQPVRHQHGFSHIT